MKITYIFILLITLCTSVYAEDKSLMKSVTDHSMAAGKTVKKTVTKTIKWGARLTLGTVVDVFYTFPRKIINGDVKGQQHRAESGEFRSALSEIDPIFNDPYQVHDRSALEFGAAFYNPLIPFLSRTAGETLQFITYGFSGKYNVFSPRYLKDIPHDISNTTKGSLGISIKVRDIQSTTIILDKYRNDSEKLKEELEKVKMVKYHPKYKKYEGVPVFNWNGIAYDTNKGELVEYYQLLYSGEFVENNKIDIFESMFR